jgi:hypothetical protein
MHRLDSRAIEVEPLPTSSIEPRESAVYDQSDGGSLSVPNDSMSGWGLHESGPSLTLAVGYDHNQTPGERQPFNGDDDSVLHGPASPMASFQAISAATESDAESWSGFYLRNDQPAIVLHSDADYSMIQAEVPEASHSWDASSSSFSFLDDTRMSASCSVSGTGDNDPADACTLDQSILTAYPGSTIGP